ERHWQSLGRQWTDAGLSRGRCPLCLYSLTGARADDRDLAQCAECGAAWHHNRIRPLPDRHLPQWPRLLHHIIGPETRRSLRDDAGRAFAAERLRAIRARARRSDPQLADTVGRVRESSGVTRRGTALLIGLLILGQTLLLLRGALRHNVSPVTLVMLLLMVVFVAIILGAILCSDFGLTARSRRRPLLPAGLCHACAGRSVTREDSDPTLNTCAGRTPSWRTNHPAQPLAPDPSDPSAPSDPSTHTPPI